MIHRQSAALLLAMTMILAACGGGSGSTSEAPSEPPATSALSNEPSAGTSVIPSTAETSAPTSGGGEAGGVCELATVDEVAAAFGLPSVTTKVLDGAPNLCIVDTDAGRTIASWSLTTTDAVVIYESLVLPGQSTDVPGIGDRAAFVDYTGLLVLKGDRMVVISIAAGADLEEPEGMEVSKRIAAAIAGRL